MRLPTICKLAGAVLLVNLLLLLYLVSHLRENGSSSENSGSALSPQSSSHEGQCSIGMDEHHWQSAHLHVEIWSKAAMGQYVWENVLRGSIDKRHESGLYIEGTTQIDNVTLRFRSGPSLKVASLMSFSVANLVLILNWRSEEKINYSLPWLEAIQAKEEVRNVGIIALGDERCNNQWFLGHLQASSKIRFLFVVYDWRAVDNERIFQWPLGLATYRNFPSSDLSSLSLHSSRPYLCNFIASIYEGSSRQELVQLFESQPQLAQHCLVKVRHKWQGHETDHSLEFYVRALQLSQLTLSPAGRNPECYRILEAVEYGSVPVIELNPRQEPGGNHCDQHTALRLFQQLNAPFIYVSNWTQQLPGILQRQQELSEESKAQQRVQLIKWYFKFKVKLRNTLVTVIRSKFIT